MNPGTLLTSAHWVMAITFSMSMIILYFAYGANMQLAILTQVLLHVGLIIFPALFKISYIIRLTALKQLGRPVD
jgi:hypothetical protein